MTKMEDEKDAFICKYLEVTGREFERNQRFK